MHYLNDFLVLGNPGSNECQTNLSIIKECCEKLGIPLALVKVEGPSILRNSYRHCAHAIASASR